MGGAGGGLGPGGEGPGDRAVRRRPLRLEPAAEVAAGLAIVLTLYRLLKTVNLDQAGELNK